MTATPHVGKEQDFQLFLTLLDCDRFEGKHKRGVQSCTPRVHRGSVKRCPTWIDRGRVWGLNASLRSHAWTTFPNVGPVAQPELDAGAPRGRGCDRRGMQNRARPTGQFGLARNTDDERVQPIRSPITVAGIAGNSLSSRRISNSTSSTALPGLAR